MTLKNIFAWYVRVSIVILVCTCYTCYVRVSMLLVCTHKHVHTSLWVMMLKNISYYKYQKKSKATNLGKARFRFMQYSIFKWW